MQMSWFGSAVALVGLTALAMPGGASAQQGRVSRGERERQGAPAAFDQQ
jgi:hypothetical protein